MSKSRRHKKPKISLYLFRGNLPKKNMVFLVDKKRKVYKTVGGAEENWVRPPQKTWNYDFPDEDWIKASEQEKKSIRCWLPKKYWHLDVKA